MDYNMIFSLHVARLLEETGMEKAGTRRKGGGLQRRDHRSRPRQKQSYHQNHAKDLRGLFNPPPHDAQAL